MTAVVTETYSLQIVAPNFTGKPDELQAWAHLPKLLEAAQEDLADLLPEGWEVRIRFKSEEATSV